jgi:23S rRNA pseudouridine2605 synthase
MPAERLQKLMAAAGIGSRRTCETLISEGRVQVNGKTVTELGVKADPARDRIAVDGVRLEFQPQHVYYKVHKPRGVISDIGGDEVDLRTGELRRTVDDLLPPGHTRVFPVGRLDLHSEGLVLLTDDGELANRLTHPRYQHPKTYYVLLGEQPTQEALVRLRNGVDLPEGRSAPAEVMIVGYLPATLKLSKGPNEGVWLRVVLREGKKRQIRHMTAAVGYPTLRLLRWSIGPLTLGDLELGQARPLTTDEVNALRKLAGLTTIKESKGPPRKGTSSGRTSSGRTGTGRTGTGRTGTGRTGTGRTGAGRANTGRPGGGKPNPGSTGVAARTGPAKRIRLVAVSKSAESAGRSHSASRPAAGGQPGAKPASRPDAGPATRPSSRPPAKSGSVKGPGKSPATGPAKGSAANRPASAKPGSKGTSGGQAKSPKKEQRRG